jgi:hypothetical protein
MSPEVRHTYQIVVKGELDPNWSDWLNGAVVNVETTPEGMCVTALSGINLDQAALRGILNQMWDLNLELIAVLRTSDNHIKSFTG